MRLRRYLCAVLTTVFAGSAWGQQSPAPAPGGAPAQATLGRSANGDTVYWSRGRPDCDERFENGTRWRRTLVQGTDTLIVSVARFSDPNYLLVALHVFNAGSRSVTVDPAAISLGARQPGDSTYTALRPWTRQEVVSQVEKRYKKERRGATFGAVLSALAARYRNQDTQTSATVFTSDGRVAQVNATTTPPRSDQPSEAEVARHQRNLSDISGREAAERATMQNALLATQTVDGKRYVVGGVAFEKQPKAESLVLLIPIGRALVGVAMPPESAP